MLFLQLESKRNILRFQSDDFDLPNEVLVSVLKSPALSGQLKALRVLL